MGATVAVGRQQVEVVAQGVAQQQAIASDVKLAQLQPADAGTGEGDAIGDRAFCLAWQTEAPQLSCSIQQPACSVES